MTIPTAVAMIDCWRIAWLSPKKIALKMIARHLRPRWRKPERMNPRNASSSQIAGTAATMPSAAQSGAALNSSCIWTSSWIISSLGG